MLRSFQFAKLPLVFFGCGKRSELPGLIRRYGNKIILVTRSSSFLRTEQGKNLVAALDEKCITSLHIEIDSEPFPEIIDEAVKRSQGFNPEVVVAIGGGSVMDAGKAISAMI